MKNVYLLICLLSVLIFSQCKKTGPLQKNEKLTVLDLEGNAFEQGFLHGKLLKEQIDTILQQWKLQIELEMEADFDTVLHSFFENTTMIDSISKYCPSLLEEVKGIAEGSEHDFKLILALQMSEEIEWAGKDLFSTKCTSLSFSGNNLSPTLVAQNMDPPMFLQGFPTLLHIRDSNSGTESFVYTFPGFIGLCGMSENVAVTCNGISMLNHCKDGVPVAFLMRTLLNCKNENEAFNKVETLKHATPQCYTIGGIQIARCFECSANSVVEFHPYKNPDITFHTNFAAANKDFSTDYIQLLGKYGKTTAHPYFCPRYFFLFDKIKDLNYILNVENIKTLLSLTEPFEHPISNKLTYGSLIMEMKKAPVLYISSGKPHETEFLTFQFGGQ